MIGQRFGRLTVLDLASGGISGPLHSKEFGTVAKCRCICGDERWYRAVELRAGKRLTCPGRHQCSLCGAMLNQQGMRAHMRLYHPGVLGEQPSNMVHLRQAGGHR